MNISAVTGAGAAVCALLVLPAGAQAQAVLLRLAPPVGQVTRSREVWQSFPSGDTTRASNTSTTYRTQTVMGMDGANYVVKIVLDSTITSMGTGDIDRGMIFTAHVDTRGHVLSIEVTPPPGMPPSIANMFQQANGSNVGKGTGTDMPERAVSPGDTWTDTVFTGTSEDRRPGVVTSYKLERVEGHTAIVSIRSVILGDERQTALAGEMAVDLDAGRISHRTMTTYMSLQPHQGIQVWGRATMELLP